MTGKYSGYVKGDILPYRFTRNGDKSGWRFYLGDCLIADLRKDFRDRWVCIVQGQLSHYLVPRMVSGFLSRQDAVDYALKVHELTYETYNSLALEAKESWDRIDKMVKEKYGE